MVHRAAAAVAVVLLLLQGTAAIRTIEDNVANGRKLKNIAPGCNQACCYDPQWWLNTRPAPIVTCIDGDSTDLTAADLAQACDQGSFPNYQYCTTGPTGASLCANDSGATCEFHEAPGDNASEDMLPCWLQEYNGQYYEVYDPLALRGNNKEIVWACADAPQGGPAGVNACGAPNNVTYTDGASYSATWGWNIGFQTELKKTSTIFKQITAGLSLNVQHVDTNTQTTTSSVTVQAQPGEHACVAKGTLVHHGWGTMYIYSENNIAIGGCKSWRVDNWATDVIITDPDDPDYATTQQWGGDVKPCGYPLLDGAL